MTVTASSVICCRCMEKLRIKQSYIDYTLVTLMFCICGNPAFTATYPLGKLVFGLFLVLLVSIMGFRIEKTVWKTSLVWMVFLGIIFMAQFVQFGKISVLGSLNFMAKMLCAILFASYMGERMQEAAINVMAIVCAISLPLYLFNLAGGWIPSPIQTNIRVDTLVIYTQNIGEATSGSLFRNSGMFWEPGAFAGYILVTFMLFVDRLEVLLGKYRLQTILLFVALLTTMSTTGYIVFFLFVFYYIFETGMNGKRQWAFSLLLAVGLLVLAFLVFKNADFLGEKISKELTASEQLTKEDADPSRTGSIIFDLPYILSHPLFGNGVMPETRLRFHLDYFTEEQLNGFGNGFSGCIATMGILFMLAYLLSIGLNKTLRAKWFVILLVVLLLQGEYFLNYPFFMLFPFLAFGPAQEKPHRLKFKLVWNRKDAAA